MHFIVPPTAEQVTLSDSSSVYTDGSIAEVDQSERHTFTCNVKDTRPYANITWQINGNIPPGNFVVVPPSTAPITNELVDSSSTLAFLPDRNHHKNELKCVASINVNGAPSVEQHVIVNVTGKGLFF